MCVGGCRSLSSFLLWCFLAMGFLSLFPFLYQHWPWWKRPWRWTLPEHFIFSSPRIVLFLLFTLTLPNLKHASCCQCSEFYLGFSKESSSASSLMPSLDPNKLTAKETRANVIKASREPATVGALCGLPCSSFLFMTAADTQIPNTNPSIFLL